MKKNRNNHIYIVSPSLKMGGIERALSVLANYFVTQGYQITFISCLVGQRFYELNSEIQLIEPSFKRTGDPLNKLLFYPRIIQFIRKQVTQGNPDVVLAFGDWFSPLVLLALYGTKIPVFISDRTSPDYKFKFPIPGLKKWLYPKSAGFIAQTTRAAEYKINQFNHRLKIQVIPNAIREVKKFDVPREKTILYVGRFAWQKGPERLIRAYASITDRKGWKLHMAGSGPLLQPMKKLAIELGIENEVIFHGKVENVDLLYSKAGIYVLPSVLEGFPNSLCEAMAAGLPCLCFDSIPYEDIFTQNKSGIAIKDGDIQALTQQLSKLISDNKERKKLGNNAIKIRERLGVERIGQQVLKFIIIQISNLSR